MQPGERSAFLAAEARAHDPDRTLCALFAPPVGRDAVLALLLLNWELARVPELVSQPIAGMIRYQWWRDGLEGAAAGRVREQPVLQALVTPIARGDLDLAELQALIDAREQELEGSRFETLVELEMQLTATAGRLQELWLAATGEARPAWREAARAAGIAYGLVGVARAVPWQARQGRVLLPAAVLAAAGLGTEDVLRDRARGRLGAPVKALVSRAGQIIDEVRRAGRAPRAAVSALLPARVALEQGRRLASVEYDPAHPAAALRPPLLPVRLAAAWLRRRA